MLKLDFERLPGFSKLFIDFLKRKAFFTERFFYETDLLEREKILVNKLKSYSNRNTFVRLLQKSNSSLKLTNRQRNNLILAEKENTFVVTTGQQPGFLGGPLYTFYKTLTAIKLAEKLNRHYPQYNFVPLFWIEDNDHDCIEAFESVLLDRQFYENSMPIPEQCKKGWHNAISELKLSPNFFNFIELFLSTNELEGYEPELSKFLIELHKEEQSLVNTFQKILNYIFGEYGLIFIKASECRNSGAFKDILVNEFERFGATFSVIETANRLIESQGYPIQAKNSLPNLFYHSSTKRTKVEWDYERKVFILGNETLSDKEMIDFFERNSNRFSPNVLLRPICQDYLLPNVASILGPSEIGYTTQLKELYEWFNISMPAIVPRHSISFLPKEFFSTFDNYGIEFFFRTKEKLEEHLYNIHKSEILQQELKAIEQKFIQIFEKLKEIGQRIDRSLEISAEAHYSKANKPFQSFINKILLAEKRNIVAKHKDLFQINNILFPNGTLQERVLSMTYPLLFFGVDKFLKEIEQVIKEDQEVHYLIFI